MKAHTFTKETVLGLEAGSRGFPPFKPGDAIRVAERIKEGSKERIQYFEGDVIAVHKNGAASTFTVRRIAANSIAVEKIFPYYSPKIEEIKFIREGDVRRAKLYYMRDRIGKRARVQEKVRSHEQKEKLERRLASGQGIAEEMVIEAPVEQEATPVVEQAAAPAPTRESATSEQKPEEAPKQEETSSEDQ